MQRDTIYLDHNSTTPIDPRVVDAMTRAWRDGGANPASQHGPGRRARRVLEEAREGIAELLGAKTGGMDADRVIFTSGGTEANNQVLSFSAGDDATVISRIEHPSIINFVADNLEQIGFEVRSVPVGADGIVQFDRLEELLPSAPRLVSIMLANNETGVIQPISAIASVCQGRGTILHTDAVQAVGKIVVNFRELGASAMTIAPHKFHGPAGIGALVIRRHEAAVVGPLLKGGFQQEGLRPGTENVALAVGFHEALKIATTELPQRAARMQTLRDELEQTLRHELPDTVVIGQDAPRLPNTSCIAFPGLDRQALVMALDLAGVACSTGSACASGSSEPSPTLLAMGLPKTVIDGAIRLSLGAFTTAEEVAEAARRILKTVKHLRAQKSA
jgi:cysteine desulfurase